MKIIMKNGGIFTGAKTKTRVQHIAGQILDIDTEEIVHLDKEDFAPLQRASLAKLKLENFGRDELLAIAESLKIDVPSRSPMREIIGLLSET